MLGHELSFSLAHGEGGEGEGGGERGKESEKEYVLGYKASRESAQDPSADTLTQTH